MNERLKSIGRRIREARTSKNLSQNDLSSMIKVSPSHLSDLENGKTNISLDVFMRITEALQVSADWLLRTNVPEVSRIHSRELEDILSDCSASESQALITVLKTVKDAIHEAKSEEL